MMKKRYLFCILTLLLSVLTITDFGTQWIFHQSSIVVEAATKNSLQKKIEKRTGNIRNTYYDDFDGDGTKELFAVIGNEEGSNEIWFAGESGIKKVYSEGASVYTWSPGICKVSSKQKIIVFETGAFGSISSSLCFYVKNGKAKKVTKAGEGLTQASGKNFLIFPSAYDAIKEDGSSSMIGHTCKAYYLKWNGSKFVEYKGKVISQKKLKTYKGASSYLNKIKKLGYKVGKIYYRQNGIININLTKRISSQTYNENVTLKVKKNKVTLMVNYSSGNNIVEKSSYNGIYQEKGLK